MAYLVTIRDVYPPARTDGDPWTGMKTEESSDGLVTWTEIDDWTFPVPDADPENPVVRNRSIDTATLEHGYYRVQFYDAAGNVSSWSDIMENKAIPTWAPAVRDIASLMRARTNDDDGNEVGMFGPDTRPTAEAVEEEIENQAGFMSMIVGFAPASSEVAAAARNLTKLRAAMFLESSYFPEQIENGHSPFNSWQEQYKLDMIELKKILDPGGDGGSPPGPGEGMPSYHFPDPELAGWESRW